MRKEIAFSLVIPQITELLLTDAGTKRLRNDRISTAESRRYARLRPGIQLQYQLTRVPIDGGSSFCVLRGDLFSFRQTRVSQIRITMNLERATLFE